MLYTDQKSIRRGVYRLTNLDDDDAAMIEHDASSLEGINIMVHEGLNDAQEWMLRAAYPDPWLVVGTDVVVSGSDSDAGGRYMDLESDFLRLFGDENATAFYVPGNPPRYWGRQLPGPREGRHIRGDGYWVEGDRVRFTRNAKIKNNLVYDYIKKPDEPADGTNIDFPEIDRGLVVAFAARHAMENNFLPAGPEMETKIARNLQFRKTQAWKRARRTTAARKLQKPNVSSATHWFTAYD